MQIFCFINIESGTLRVLSLYNKMGDKILSSGIKVIILPAEVIFFDAFTQNNSMSCMHEIMETSEAIDKKAARQVYFDY